MGLSEKREDMQKNERLSGNLLLYPIRIIHRYANMRQQLRKKTFPLFKKQGEGMDGSEIQIGLSGDQCAHGLAVQWTKQRL